MHQTRSGESKRIVVIGTSGSGKSTFSRKLSAALSIPHIELDALHWESNWIEAPVDVFKNRVESALTAGSWVVDGNYGKVRNAIWSQADTLIWLDYSFPVVFGRALFRTIKRSLFRERLWAGNRESVRRSFFSKHSILVWVIQTYSRRRKEIPELLLRTEYSHLKIIRFRAPKQADAYLRMLNNDYSPERPS